MTTKKKLLGLLVLALAACTAENRSSVQILGRAAPSSDTECTYAAGGEFDGRVAGKLDVGAAYATELTYFLPLYVDNNLVDPTSQSSATVTEAKTWTVRAARVRVNPSSYVDEFAPNPAMLPFQAENVVPANGQSIQPDGSGVIMFEAVSHALGLALQGALAQATTGTDGRRVVLGITLQGQTADGRPLDTGEWFYPIDVCAGCLPIPACVAPAVPVSGCGGPGQDVAPVCVTP